MRYDAVFFDFDGTVADTLENITDAVNHTMRQFGKPEVSPERLKHQLGWGADYLLRTLTPSVTEEELRAIIAYYRPYYAEHATEKVRPYPGILPVMEALRRAGLKLAIVSNKPDAAMQPVAKRYFGGLVSLAIGELPGLPRKPAPDMLNYTADRLGVSLSRCLYVGDTEVDIQTAQNAGIDCVCVTWGFRTREALLQAGAAHIIDREEELLALLDSGETGEK